MDKKTGMIIAVLIGLGSALPIWIFGMCCDLAPFNKYVGVFWMCFLPLAIYYSNEHPQLKNILNMICSFVMGLGWGYLGVILTPMLKIHGELPFAFVEYFLLVFLILFVAKGPLGRTWFNHVPCTFLGFALSIVASTTSFWSGKINFATHTLTPIEGHWNQLDLLIIFMCGIVMTVLVELCCKLFIGTYLKKKGMLPPKH